MGLTTKNNYSGNHSETGSRGEPSDPFRGSEVITSPADPTKEVATPLTHEGSSVHTGEGSLSEEEIAEIRERDPFDARLWHMSSPAWTKPALPR